MKGGFNEAGGGYSSGVGASAGGHSVPSEETLRSEASFTYLARGHQRADLVRISSGVATVLGYEAEALVERRDPDYETLIHVEDRPRVASAIADSVAQVAPFQVRYRALSAAGYLRWLWERGNPIVDPDTRRVTAIAGFVVDVTALVDELEAQRQRAEIAASVRSLASVARRLQAPPAPLPETAKSPSVSNSGPGERSVSPSRQSPDILTELSKLSREHRVELREADVNELVRRATGSLVSALPDASSLVLSLNESIPLAIVCSESLAGALETLLRRAVRACRSGGTPIVSTGIASSSRGAPYRYESGGWVTIQITERGPGRTTERAPRLFEPFEDDGTGEMGLELCLAWRAIAGMGGWVTAEQLPSREFEVTVALRARAPASDTLRTSLIRPREAAVAPKGTVLVVDDMPVVRRTTTLALRRAGFRVLVAQSPNEAITLIEAIGESIDVLVTDVVMPGTSGKDIAVAFRQRSPTAGILFVSGYSEESALSCSDHGERTLFLQKPFGFLELADAVSKLVRLPESSLDASDEKVR